MTHAGSNRIVLQLVLILSGFGIVCKVGQDAAPVLIPGFLYLLLSLPALMGLRLLLKGPSTDVPARRPRFQSRHHATCLVCQTALLKEIVFCTRCMTPHHKECFLYIGTCSVFGCGCGTYQLRSRSAELLLANDEVEFLN